MERSLCLRCSLDFLLLYDSGVGCGGPALCILPGSFEAAVASASLYAFTFT
ncbi:hypothetical protein D1872_334090 [compost metagenome]